MDGGTWAKLAARAGLVAKGLLYLVVALLALQVAVGARGQTSDQQGALRAVARQPGGPVLLSALAVGLAGYAVWRFVQVFRYTEEDGRLRQAVLRAAGVVRGVFYAALSVLTVRIILGASGGGGRSQSRATATILQLPGGVLLVAGVGLVIIGVGVYQGYRGLTGEFRQDLDSHRMGPRARRWVPRLGLAGHAARMLVFVLIGAFIVQAAVSGDPQQSVGLDGVLQQLARSPVGPWLLGFVAVGLLAYGVFCLVQARYVRVAAT